jgi:hypothetical protein
MITTGGALGANSGATVLGSPVIQVSYERDPWTADQAGVAYTIDTAVQSSNCTRFNAWANDVICPLITTRSDRADELYYMQPAGDSITATAASAEFRQCFQGAVLALSNTVNTLADLKLSKVLYEFEVDMYGFTNIAAAVLPSNAPPAPPAPCPAGMRWILVPIDKKEQHPDAGDSKRPSDDDPDAVEFIDLTPKSNRGSAVSLSRESAGSVRESARPAEASASRPPSLKGTRV